MPACRICREKEGKYEVSTIADICLPCAKRQGLAKPMPSLRPNVPCRRCEGTVFVRAFLRNRDTDGEARVHTLAPIAAVQVVEPAVGHRHFGRLESYICRRCGFTELYTREPEAIPIGPELGTELLDIGDEAPYR